MARTRSILGGAVSAAFMALLVACGTDDPAQLVAKARTDLERGDVPAAVGALDRAIAANPALTEAYRLLADVHLQRGELPEAILKLTKALELEPTDVSARASRGIAFMELGEPQHALVDFDRAVQTDPNDLRARLMRGEARASLDMYREALADADVLVGGAEDRELLGQALWLRGRIRLRLGNLDGGIADLTRLIEIAPEGSDAYVERGRAQGAAGRYEDALRDFRRALDVQPADSFPWLLIAQLYLAQDKLDDARKALDQASARLPDHPRLRLVRGELEARAGDVARAREDLEAAIRMAGDDAQVAAQATRLLQQLLGR